MTNITGNLSVCGRLEERVEADNLCLSKAEELAAIATAAVVVVANLLHLVVLLHDSAALAGKVFYTILWIQAIFDILTSLVCCVIAFCPLRKELVLFKYNDDGLKLVSILVLTCIVFQMKVCLNLFAVVERWHILAKPFGYYDSIYVTKFWIWVALAVVFSVKWNFMTGFLYFYLNPLRCFDVGFGVISSGSSFKYLVSSQYLISCTLVNIYGVLFLIEYRRMRNHGLPNRASDISSRQACNYMLISTIAQAVVFCALFGMEIVLLTLESHVIAQQITIWTLTFFQTFGLWNILALYLTLKSYREKVRHVLCLCVTKQQRRVSDGIALPDITNDSRVVCPYQTAQTE